MLLGYLAKRRFLHLGERSCLLDDLLEKNNLLLLGRRPANPHNRLNLIDSGVIILRLNNTQFQTLNPDPLKGEPLNLLAQPQVNVLLKVFVLKVCVASLGQNLLNRIRHYLLMVVWYQLEPPP